jgi:hypothetical protein
MYIVQTIQSISSPSASFSAGPIGSSKIMADLVGQAGTTHSRSSAPRVRLTCEACRQRKVKCDKLSPCTSCERLGLVCVPVERARLPRGRTRKPERMVGSDKELSERVARLEKLLKRVVNERDGLQVVSTGPEPSHPYTPHQSAAEASKASPDNPQGQSDYLPSAAPPHLPRPSTVYVGSPFWEDIMQQVSLLNSWLAAGMIWLMSRSLDPRIAQCLARSYRKRRPWRQRFGI